MSHCFCFHTINVNGFIVLWLPTFFKTSYLVSKSYRFRMTLGVINDYRFTFGLTMPLSVNQQCPTLGSTIRVNLKLSDPGLSRSSFVQCLWTPANHLQNESEEGGADAEGQRAADGPAQPVDGALQSHHPHGLLQTRFLLLNHALYYERYREDPGQGHVERQGARQRPQEPVHTYKYLLYPCYVTQSKAQE